MKAASSLRAQVGVHTGEEILRYWNGYKGASFSELLEQEFPQLHTTMAGCFSAAAGPVENTPHGTTCLALTYSGGVLVAGDRLATMGYQVASREIDKVYATDRYSLMALSGAAGPAAEMARLVGVQFEHREKIEGRPLELEGKANTLSGLVRQNLPAAMQGLAVVPIFAGYDLRRNIGRVWKYEITGGRYEEREFECVGSGGIFARESLKKSFTPGASREQAVQAALGALTDAADEDRATGGVDLRRAIYPRIKTCTAEGIEALSDEEIAEAYRALPAGAGRAEG